MPKVSIIIPVYNVEKYIRECLDSIVNQTLKDIEIICVNDCSPDKSIDIIKDYAKNDSRIKIIEQQTNQGQGIARNVALDSATGEYVMFLDPDDWYELDACEKVYNQAHKNDNDLVFFEARTVSSKKSRCLDRLLYLREFKENNNIHLKDLAFPFITGTEICFIASKLSFLNENNIRFSEERFDEDNIFCIKQLIHSKSASILDEIFYNYRVLDSSATNKTIKNHWEVMLKSKKDAFYEIKSIPDNDNYLKMYIPYCLEAILFWFKRFSKKNKGTAPKLYNDMQFCFREITKDIDFEDYKLNSDEYKIILNKPYWVWKLKVLKKRIWGYEQIKDRKIFYILGIKISV